MTIKENEPLTAEQLEKFRKENLPVWVETIGYANNKSGWALAGTRQAITQDFWPHPLWYSSYMMDWVAYKNKRNVKEVKTMIDTVKGLCCDCVYGDGQCCDYSENETCKRRKEDGSCWEAYNAGQWISVKDRLPGAKGEYIVAYHPCYWDDVNPKMKVGIDTFRGKSTWAKKKYQRVTHWMPLPEPPKGDDDDED